MSQSCVGELLIRAFKRFAEGFFHDDSSITSGGSSSTDLGLGIGVGLEFLSNFYVSPFIGGSFAWEYMNAGGTLNALDISVGGGVRFSWIK